MRTEAHRARATLGAVAALLVALGACSPSHVSSPASGTESGDEVGLVQWGQALATSDTSVSLTLGRPTGPASVLVAYVVWDQAGTVSLADDQGNAWTSAIGPTTAADGTSSQVFHASTAAAGAHTLTATFASPITTRAVLYVHEYGGLDPLEPLAAAMASVGTSAEMSVGPLTTETEGELLFVGAASNGEVLAPDAPDWKTRAHRPGELTFDAIAHTPGPQSFAALQTGSAWSLQLVAFRKRPRRLYPLEVGPTGRYLVDRNGRPFFIFGDSPQALTVNVTEAEADAFLANRQSAGFNVVWVNLLNSTYTGGRANGSTFDGIVPFTTHFDLATPNEAYFARVDRLLRRAAARGLLVILDPAETGSFLAVLRSNGLTKARDYGRYLGTRYRGFDNIVWMSGNDFQTWANEGDDVLVRAVAQGIRETDERHLHTVLLDFPVSGSLDDPTWAPLIELNSTYTYLPTYAQVLADYNRPNAIPTFMCEANYEFENNTGSDPPEPEVLRRQAYWSLLSGAAGHLYGNHFTWQFKSGWQSNVDTPGSRQMGHVKDLFEGRGWWNLVPDQTHAVVIAGYGTFTSSGSLMNSDYVTAARTPNGGLVMAYVPTVRTITVDMTKLASAATARWWDPTIGEFSASAGPQIAERPHGQTPAGAQSEALLEKSGTRDFRPPGPNAGGDGDWVLVLEATSIPPDTQAPTVPTALAASAVAGGQATISWNASTDDVAVAAYRLYRDGVLRRTHFGTAFTDVGLAARTTYTYTVEALDHAGNVSDASAPLAVTTSGPTPTFVQANAATPQTPQSTVGATYAGAQVAGHTNIVAVGWNDTISNITTLTDSAGNTYQLALATFRGNGLSQAIFHAANIRSAAAGTNRVTVRFDRAAVFVDLRIVEYAGLRTASPREAGVSRTGVGSLANSGTLTTITPAALLFAAGMTDATFSGAGAGFHLRLLTTPNGDLVEDSIGGPPGLHGATAPLTSGKWVLQLVAFAGG